MYYQPQPATNSLFCQPQPATYNQRQHYCQGRRIQQALSKNGYDRQKVERHDNIHSGIPTTDKKYPLCHWGIFNIQ